MRTENLYFIAIIPKRELREKITAIKQDFAHRFNSKTALKVYPHITLKAPFKLAANAHHELMKWFDEVHVLQQPFTVQLKNFGEFNNKKNPVIFVHPESSKELMALQKQLIASFASFFPGELHNVDISFNPHITVAYRDLSPDMFAKAWNEYQHKTFDASFDVDAVYLLQHDSKKWNIIATHDLPHNIPAF